MSRRVVTEEDLFVLVAADAPERDWDGDHRLVTVYATRDEAIQAAEAMHGRCERLREAQGTYRSKLMNDDDEVRFFLYSPTLRTRSE
ncbi:MAG: hypothetical protein IT371_30300 [Deltaproteobacteria bacterium]|nr:hypothetical protein [Deltaproteobacteria bacterium]